MNKWPRVGSDEIYTMIGDKELLMFMISDLVRVCHAVPAMPRKFDPTTTATVTQPRPENVIQYYRSSSFALTYAKYNNTFALSSSNPTTNHASVSLPASIVDSAFLRCVNDTIRASLPLMDPLDPPKKKLSPGAIAGICIGPSDSSTPPMDAPIDATTIVPTTESEQVTPEDTKKNAGAPELSPAYNKKNDEMEPKKQEEGAKEGQNVVWV
ncbi:hypothetical protein FRC17_009497 [Serendipita sp. 399]|nr:hypothetical protein FRC17_009497 [Serendipita sp. 399]